MKKYLLIGICYGHGSGSHTASKTLAEKFPEYIEYKRDGSFTETIDELSKDYKKIIFTCQTPWLYGTNIHSGLSRVNHLIVIRDEFNNKLFNSASNGFWYYKQHPEIKHYLPLIPDMSHINTEPDIPCLGFYVRDRAFDSYRCFLDLVSRLDGVDVCTMGKPMNIFNRLSNVRNYSHTIDNEIFFKTISHYVYPASGEYIDPFPTSLCEAVQAGKQIIIPEAGRRRFRDGIDDIKDCIDYHTDFNPNVKYQPGLYFDFDNFKDFYLMLFENDFEFSFDRDKYNSYLDLLCSLDLSEVYI
jgi:hypothetical protein